jgi:DNA-binding transcriptional ArsR family regulator
MKKTKRSSPARGLSREEMSEIRQRLAATPNLEKTSQLLNVAGSATRLKLLYLLEQEKGLPVGDLAERLGVSVPAISQHLGKLRSYGLVASRREGQNLYYRLTAHPFNEKLRATLL